MPRYNIWKVTLTVVLDVRGGVEAAEAIAEVTGKLPPEITVKSAKAELAN